MAKTIVPNQCEKCGLYIVGRASCTDKGCPVENPKPNSEDNG